MAKFLIERHNVGTMTYMAESKDSASPFLAHFEGIVADYKNPTRNGRLYPKELWCKVAESPDFKEAMETRTCLGELNHPMQDDRLDIDLEKVAIVLLNFEVREDGNVWARFGILDTPNGRLLKTLLDSGCQIGVSSRGSGDVVESSNGPIVEADTYYFVCFDAVVTPAVITARPSMTESTEIDATNKAKSLTESINEEISNAKTTAELTAIQSVLESINLPEMDSIQESINIKSSELQSGDDISSGLLTDLAESLRVNEQLTTELDEIKKSTSANDIRVTRLENLVSKFRASSKDLRSQLLESASTIESLSKELVESAAQCENLSNEIETLKEQHQELISDRDRLLESNKHMRGRNAQMTDLSDDLAHCKDQLSEAVAKVKQLELRNSDLKNKNSELTTLVESSKRRTAKIASEYNDAKQQMKQSLQSYLHLQSSTSGISESVIINNLPETYTCDDIDKAVASIISYNDRMRKMPITMTEGLDREHVLSVEMQTPISDEDALTTSILTNFK